MRTLCHLRRTAPPLRGHFLRIRSFASTAGKPGFFELRRDRILNFRQLRAPSSLLLAASRQFAPEQKRHRTGLKAIADKTQLVIDYTVFRADGTTALESSKDTRRMPFAFTVGTGAVHRAIDEAVRDMKPGDVRRVAVPAGYDKGSQISEAVVVQIRLRNIKGPSELNICAVPPIEVGPSILCQPGVGRVML